MVKPDELVVLSRSPAAADASRMLAARAQRTTAPGATALVAGIGAAPFLAALAAQVEPVAVFVVDAERRVVHWSDAAADMLGFSAAEMLGEFCLKGSRCHQCVQGCGIAEHGSVRDVPMQMYTASGDMVAVRKTAEAFYDAEGAFIGGIEVLVPDAVPLDHGALPVARVGGGHAGERVTFHGIVSQDPAMRDVFHVLANVAQTDATVLVRGESGTGKELFASAVHAESERRSGPFLAINCAAMSASLLESELFGHERGAFTGAVKTHQGLFERADGGTLFLDEVAELPLELQAKLLRVLQERTFFRVGGTKPIQVDVRIVSATHRGLRDEVAAGRFREDLMYRLRVVPIYLPPLRERRGDVSVLLWHFVAQNNARGRRQVSAVAPEAMRALLDHRWPGNVRELQNVMEYAFAVGRGPEITEAQLPPEFREAPPVPGVRAARQAAENEEARAIREALAEAGGHIGKAAALLGMSRPTFWRKRKKLGV